MERLPGAGARGDVGEVFAVVELFTPTRPNTITK
jgi:hypothetical protein